MYGTLWIPETLNIKKGNEINAGIRLFNYNATTLIRFQSVVCIILIGWTYHTHKTVWVETLKCTQIQKIP